MKTKRTQKEVKGKKWHTKEQLCNVTNPHEPPAAVKRPKRAEEQPYH